MGNETSGACRDCPFRIGSVHYYDDDAHEALEDGNIPACHKKAGLDRIFAHAPLDPVRGSECAGHAAWESNIGGFCVPARIGENHG